MTYLPIVTLRQWLGSRSFESEALTFVRSEARLLGVDVFSDLEAGMNLEPGHLTAFEAALGTSRAEDQRKREAKARCSAGLSVLKHLVSGTALGDPASAVKLLCGPKTWSQLIRQLITNYRRDLHFLPADGLPPDWSILTDHSLVLFRYPLTAPVSVFDAAQDVTLADWPAWVRLNSPIVPLAAAFSAARPLKGLTLKKDFLADLLTRYAGLYLRIGSPDFSQLTIDEFISQIEPR